MHFREVADFCRPVIHFHIDVCGVVAAPGRAENQSVARSTDSAKNEAEGSCDGACGVMATDDFTSF